MPHYMFYAPYLKEADIGGNSDSGGPMVLGENNPKGYTILPAGTTEKGQIVAENKNLLKRLSEYKSYFEIPLGFMNDLLNQNISSEIEAKSQLFLLSLNEVLNRSLH